MRRIHSPLLTNLQITRSVIKGVARKLQRGGKHTDENNAKLLSQEAALIPKTIFQLVIFWNILNEHHYKLRNFNLHYILFDLMFNDTKLWQL